MARLPTRRELADKIDKLEKLASSFEDVNYHTVSKPLWDAIDALINNDDKKLAGQFLKKFNKGS